MIWKIIGTVIISNFNAFQRNNELENMDTRRIKSKQGVLEDNYWEEIEKAICIELGFSLAFKTAN